MSRGATDATTDGHLLNGRISYRQPAQGFRSGIEPVLLAASVPARLGERIIEGGTGAGAALLCLAARVPDLHAVGVERDAELAAIATHNAEANSLSNVSIVAADLTDLPELGSFDHAMANPPYHPEAGTPSPMTARAQAKQGGRTVLATWARALSQALRHRATLTFILAAGAVPDAMAAMADAGCAPSALLPLWPKAGRPAKLVLLRGVKGTRAPMRLLPGLQLHDANGDFTPEATAILRDGAALAME